MLEVFMNLKVTGHRIESLFNASVHGSSTRIELIVDPNDMIALVARRLIEKVENRSYDVPL